MAIPSRTSMKTKRVASNQFGGGKVELPLCGHINQNLGSCGLFAGAGTAHKGVGYCRFHGGPLGKGQTYAAWFKLHRKALKELIKVSAVQDVLKQMGDDPDVFDIREHIRALEALAVVMINQNDLVDAGKMVVEATKAVERLHAIEVGRRYVITVVDVSKILEQVVTIIERFVKDEHAKGLIARELANVSLNAGGNEVVSARGRRLLESGPTVEGVVT